MDLMDCPLVCLVSVDLRSSRRRIVVHRSAEGRVAAILLLQNLELAAWSEKSVEVELIPSVCMYR